MPVSTHKLIGKSPNVAIAGEWFTYRLRTASFFTMEQDMIWILHECTAPFSDCDKSLVAGISFGGQMHGLVVLDENDNVIRPAILWNDGRTGKETDYLNQVIGKNKLSEYTKTVFDG